MTRFPSQRERREAAARDVRNAIAWQTALQPDKDWLQRAAIHDWLAPHLKTILRALEGRQKPRG